MKMDNDTGNMKYRWRKRAYLWNGPLRKEIRIVCAMMIFVSLFAGCAAGREEAAAEDGKTQILCTAFPLYDWTRQVTAGCGDSIEVTLLMDQGADLHNYQPTAEDIVRISEADIIVYVGGESDLWMEDVLASVPEERRKLQQYLNMMEVLQSSLREEEHVENSDGDAAEGHAHGEEENTDGVEYDEHIWLSVRNASACVRAIAAAVTDNDEDQEVSQKVSDNAGRYLAELENLDGQFESMVSEAPLDRVLFADRFPFLYLMKDYGLEYYAAFPGCSTETEASFETVIFLAGKLEEYDLPALLVMENGDRGIAETVIANTADKDQQILTLNSMQSVTAADIAQGVTYLSVMQENLAVLRTALACE